MLDRRGGKDLILPLYYARLARIDGVMHLTGNERVGRSNTKANTQRVKQSWLCTLDPADARPLLERIHITHASGFSAEDDNDIEDPFAPLDYQ